MIFVWFVVSLLAGVCQPIQGAVNARLRTEVHSPYLSGAISNFIGALIMLFTALFIQKEPLTLPVFQWSSWWMWTGGLLSFCIVIATIVVPSKISYTTFFAIFIAGQLLMATLIDTFGLFGSETIPFSFQRALGILFLILGVIFVKK